MLQLTCERCLEILGVVGLACYAGAYAFACNYPMYFFITLLLTITFLIILWLFVSISVGKYLVSKFIAVVRVTVSVPFRLIRATPNVIRLIFFELPVVSTFYVWYRLLVSLDRHILRRLLYWSGGLKHGSGLRVSSVNALSLSFSPISYLEPQDTAQFDLRTGLSLANLSKLAYEDEAIVRYELERAGYNIEGYRTIAYHNTTGFVALYKSTAVVVFRGTEPLNLMHIMTDLQGGLVSLSSLDDTKTRVDAGKAHYGFLEALRLSRRDQPKELNSRETEISSTISLDDEDTIGSAFTALFKIGGFLFKSAARKPLTLKIPRSNGKITAFQQIADALSHIRTLADVKQTFCTGHSLGGALATVFFAQAQLSTMSASMLQHMYVYTYGAPRIGDAGFSRWLESTGASRRIFKVVNAQDLVPRMPTLPEQLPKALRHFPYAESPGTLIHLHPLSPKSPTLEELPGVFVHENGQVPPIVFWGLSGLLSLDTVRKIRTESWLWILARLWIPFVMFDHLASEYALVLEHLYRQSDDGHFETQMFLDR